MQPRIGRTLGRFHHRVDFRLENMQPIDDTTGRWVDPLMDNEMTALGLEEAKTYVLRRHNIFPQYIATWSIMYLCMAAEQQAGVQVAMRGWEQESLVLVQEETETETDTKEE